VAVHAIFAGDAFTALRESGVARIVSCNTVAHPSNAIDVRLRVAQAAAGLLQMAAAGGTA
jgi:ribose-phosphate pyrophosphokinase